MADPLVRRWFFTLLTLVMIVLYDDYGQDI